MLESTLTAKGQTTLPREVREALGLKPGDKLRYIVRNGKVSCVKVGSIKDLEGALYRPGQRTISLEEMQEAIGEVTSEEVS